jgi:hypothetical protein
MALSFRSADTIPCAGTRQLIGSLANIDPQGYTKPIEVAFTWDKSITGGSGVSHFVFCLSKDDGASFFVVPKCKSGGYHGSHRGSGGGSSKPTPPCELKRSRTYKGDLRIVILIAPDDPVGGLGN